MASLLFSGCSHSQKNNFYRPYAGKGHRKYDKVGVASWYGRPFHGRRTASGERYDMNELTAAHKKLPFGALLRITNLTNDRSIIVKVTDRGPFVRGRLIDLSRKAAEELDFKLAGTAKVRITWIDDPKNHPNMTDATRLALKEAPTQKKSEPVVASNEIPTENIPKPASETPLPTAPAQPDPIADVISNKTAIRIEDEALENLNE